MSLAERDELWSVRATYHAKSEGNAIDTLIQWVLVNGLKPIEETRARLAAITLAWLTTLSHRSARVMATKADRKSAVEGKSVLVRVALGGSRLIKKKTKTVHAATMSPTPNTNTRYTQLQNARITSTT